MNIDIRHREAETRRDPIWFVVAAVAIVSVWVSMICAALVHDRTLRVVVEFNTPPINVTRTVEAME